MSYKISGLSPEPFRHLFGLSDEALRLAGAVRYRVDSQPGFPDRIEMRDAEVGQTVLLLNHLCQPADTPYRASHAIFVREGAEHRYGGINEVPDVMRRRVLSLRAFDEGDMMVDADLTEGALAESLILRLLDNPKVAYIHAHYAKRGCYSGRIDRV